MSEYPKKNEVISLKSFFLICLIPVFMFCFILLSNKSFREQLFFDLKRDSMTAEIQKISYVKTMIDSNLYKVSDVEKFQSMFDKKDVYAFGNEKSKYHYTLSESNGILSISLTSLTSEECQSMFIESNRKSTEGLLIKFNGENIKNSGIKKISELKAACDKKDKAFTYEISKMVQDKSQLHIRGMKWV